MHSYPATPNRLCPRVPEHRALVPRARLPRFYRLYASLGLVSAFMAALALPLPPAQAAMPVIDVASITQLVTQVRTMAQQLTTARDQLTQAQSQLGAMTGNRGMQNLLNQTARNYLPADYQQLASAVQNVSATYSALATDIQSIRASNAILSAADLSRLTPAQRQFIEDARNQTATLDALTRGALATTSTRFAAIQQLIAAIATARDQKAVLDLQARIQAEQGMLQNEGTKLGVLYQTAEAQRQERSQRVREQAIADAGSLRSLPPLHLAVPAI
jgi:type IV secretion system protein VirB5